MNGIESYRRTRRITTIDESSSGVIVSVGALALFVGGAVLLVSGGAGALAILIVVAVLGGLATAILGCALIALSRRGRAPLTMRGVERQVQAMNRRLAAPPMPPLMSHREPPAMSNPVPASYRRDRARAAAELTAAERAELLGYRSLVEAQRRQRELLEARARQREVAP